MTENLAGQPGLMMALRHPNKKNVGHFPLSDVFFVFPARLKGGPTSSAWQLDGNLGRHVRLHNDSGVPADAASLFHVIFSNLNAGSDRGND
jgi:hypothetical protein